MKPFGNLPEQAGNSHFSGLSCGLFWPHHVRMEPAPDRKITYFAETNFRNQKQVFGIRQADRRAHMYVIGKTGTGKTTLLETMIRQDIRNGQGVALLDPHGDLAAGLVRNIPPERSADLVYFNVPDLEHPLGFNPLEQVPREKRSLAASGLLEAFKKLWSEFWGPRSEHILRNAIFALLELPQSTLADVLRLLSDPTYRKMAALRVSNPQVRAFWLKEFEGYPVRFRTEAVAPIQNKMGAFLADPVASRILNQTRSSFNLRTVIDEGKILIVNLAKGRIGETTSALLGSLLVSSFNVAALSRSDLPEESRRDFFLYLDEFHSFTTLSLAGMLSELRKYRLGLVLAHQYGTQVNEPIRDAVLGNAGTLISFRVGQTDARILEREFWPEFSAEDIVALPNYDIYLRLMIDGAVSKPFSAKTIRFGELHRSGRIRPIPPPFAAIPTR